MSYYPTAGAQNPAGIMQSYRKEIERLRNKRIEEEELKRRRDREDSNDEWTQKSRNRQEEEWGYQDERNKATDAWNSKVRKRTEEEWQNSDKYNKLRDDMNKLALNKANRQEHFDFTRDAYKAAAMGNTAMLDKMGIEMIPNETDDSLYTLKIPEIGDVVFSKDFPPQGDEAVLSTAYAQAKMKNPDITKQEFLMTVSDKWPEILKKAGGSKGTGLPNFTEINKMSTALENLDKEMENLNSDERIAELEEIVSDSKGFLGFWEDKDKAEKALLEIETIKRNKNNIEEQKKAIQRLKMVLTTGVDGYGKEVTLDLYKGMGGGEKAEKSKSTPLSKMRSDSMEKVKKGMTPSKSPFFRANPFGSSLAEQVAQIEIEKAILPKGPIDARQMQNVYKPLINQAKSNIPKLIEQAKEELGENPSQMEMTIWFRNKAKELR